MEVKLDKRYPVAASPEQSWAVLSDVRATAACMPGAAITEQLDPTHFKGTVKSKVGPAVMSFGGDIEVLGLDAATKSMQMLGKGADKSGSSASMNLSARVEPGETADSSVLVGQATIVVSGKLAQFGSRLLVPVSDAMLAQFADNFRKAATATAAPVVAVAPAVEDGAAAVNPVHPVAQAMASAAAAVPPAASGDTASTPAASSTASPTASRTASPTASPTAAPRPAAAAPTAAPARPVTPAAAQPEPANELNVLGLMWTVIKGWFAGLFGKR